MGVMMRDLGKRASGRVGASRHVIVALSAAALIGVQFLGSTVPVQAQGKDLSDDSVRALVKYAWVITPPKFTMPNGKEIIVDKKNRDAAMVPIEKARDIIRAGRLSANAQICGLSEAQAANYQTLIQRELATKKWSDQQMLFISQLHLFTVMLMTGKVTVVENEGEKDVVVKDTKIAPPKPATCTDVERKKVEDQITEYIKAEPAATPPAATPAAAAEPKK